MTFPVSALPWSPACCGPVVRLLFTRLLVLLAMVGTTSAFARTTAAAEPSTILVAEVADPAYARTLGVRTNARVVPIDRRWHRFEWPRATPAHDVAAIAARWRRDGHVLHVLEPTMERLARVPDDTLYAGEQWWLAADGAGSAGVPGMTSAWDRSTGAPASGLPPVVAILDSGYTPHPELDAKWLLPGYDFISNVDYAADGNGRDNDPRDTGDRLSATEAALNPSLWDGCETRERSSWHGTLMAGQIGALSNNGAGVAGIHWALDARLLPVRVAGRCGAAVPDVVDAIRWAAGLHVDGVPDNVTPARVIVLGVAGFASCDPSDPDPNVAAAARLYIDTLAAVRAAGSLVVAAAGNQRGAVGRPASCAGAFAVTALNRQGFKSLYANFGPQVALSTVGGDASTGRDCDDLLADSGLTSTSNTGSAAPDTFGYAAGSGTSFAAPIVAGVAALMWSVNPSLSVAQVEAGLRGSARPHVQAPELQTCSAVVGGNAGRCQCDTATCGAGVLDASQALAFAADPSAWSAPTRTPVRLEGGAVRQCALRLGFVAADPQPSPSPTPTPAPAAAGGGGGALGTGWLLALAAGVALLARPRRCR